MMPLVYVCHYGKHAGQHWRLVCPETKLHEYVHSVEILVPSKTVQPSHPKDPRPIIPPAGECPRHHLVCEGTVEITNIGDDRDELRHAEIR